MVTSTTDYCVALSKKMGKDEPSIAEMGPSFHCEEIQFQRRKAELKTEFSNFMLNFIKNQADVCFLNSDEPTEEFSRRLKKKPAIEVLEEDEEEFPLSPLRPPPSKRAKLDTKFDDGTKPKSILKKDASKMVPNDSGNGKLPKKTVTFHLPLEELKRIEELKKKRNGLGKNLTDQKKIVEKRASTSSHQPKPLFQQRKLLTTMEEFMQDLLGKADDSAKPKLILKKDASRVAPNVSGHGKLPKKTVMIHKSGSTSTSKYDENKKKGGLTEAQINAAKKLSSQQAQRSIRPVDHLKRSPNPVAQLRARPEKAAKFPSTAPKTGLFTGQEGKGSPRTAYLLHSTPRLLEPAFKKLFKMRLDMTTKRTRQCACG